MHVTSALLMIIALWAAGCMPETTNPLPAGSLPIPSDMASSRDTPEMPPPPQRSCLPPEGTTGSPSTVTEVLALINALPKPTSLGCVLESLDRPLRIDATRGTISAQPARGERSPRVFLFTGRTMTMSITLEGPGSDLLELAQDFGEFRSLKAELEFPVETVLDEGAPYRQVMFNEDVTGCAFCHAAEERYGEITHSKAFISEALRPVERERVPLERLQLEYELCDPTAEHHRCELLDGLFKWGPTEQASFPPEMPTIFD